MSAKKHKVRNESLPHDQSLELDPFNELVARSGNTFHCEVATYFRANGWSVLLSPYYVDNATGKVREVDLLCEKLWEFWNDANPKISRVFRMQLFVECKYIPENTATVFWFDEGDKKSVRELVIGSVPQFKSHTPLSDHHYYTQRIAGVAKLFASGLNRGDEKEPIYVALNQSLGALIQLGSFPTLTSQQATEVEATITCKYPVIVCSSFDRFRRTDIGGSDPAPIAHNFLMEVNYAFTNSASRPLRKYALIDVVSREALDRFLEDLEIEAHAVRLVFGF